MAPTPIYPLNRVSSGYNNTGGLTAWESIQPANEPPFFAPTWFGFYTAGKRLVRADGSLYFSGFPVVNGQLTMTVGQLWYIQNTYCGGGFSGFVTAQLRLLNPAVYNIVNAVLTISDLSANKRIASGWDHFKISLTRIVVLS